MITQMEFDAMVGGGSGNPTAPEPESTVRRARVWHLLADGQWHSTMEINDGGVGGSEGCRRLRELRDQCRSGKRPGYGDIAVEKIGGTTSQYRYRLVAGAPGSSVRACSICGGTGKLSIPCGCCHGSGMAHEASR